MSRSLSLLPVLCIPLPPSLVFSGGFWIWSLWCDLVCELQSSFLGAIFKKRGLVRTYLGVLYVTLMLQTASGIYSLVMFYRFREHPGLRPDCDNKSDTAAVDFCNALQKISNMPLSTVWVSTLVPIVVVACKLLCINSHSDQSNYTFRCLLCCTQLLHTSC